MATYNIDDAQGIALANGDIILCPYSGTIKSLTLKPGRYKFECWGAFGGNGSSNDRAVGGYSYGEYSLSKSKALYFVSGGAGADAHENVPSPGGYNGGGDGRSSGSGWIAVFRGGGGGATHIGLLNSLLIGYVSSFAENLVMVAGGAGGSGSSTLLGGNGGGVTGGNGAGSSHYGAGGTQSGGGAGDSSYGTDGVFGAGGYCTRTGSGGGGGFYGGGGGLTGGGGSGYISPTLLTNAATTQQSSSTTPDGSLNGYIRITVLEIYILEVPYIESHGAEYIDLGINFNSSTDKIEIIFQPTTSPNDELIGGGNYQSAAGEFYFGDGGHDGGMIALFGQNGAFSTGTTPVDTSKFQTFRYEDNKAYVNGVLIATNTLSIDTQYNLILFGLNRISPMGLGNYKVRSVKVWRNGSLFTNFVAAKDYRGVYGLVEKISDTFVYASAGTLTGPGINGYIGINNASRKITGGYVGVNGVSRKIIAAYVGVNGVARKIFDGADTHFSYDVALNKGNLIPLSGWATSDYIEIPAGCTNITIETGMAQGDHDCLCEYDADINYLSYWGAGANPRTFTFDYPEQIKYIRVSFLAASLGNCYVYDNTHGQYIYKGANIA